MAESAKGLFLWRGGIRPKGLKAHKGCQKRMRMKLEFIAGNISSLDVLERMSIFCLRSKKMGDIWRQLFEG